MKLVNLVQLPLQESREVLLVVVVPRLRGGSVLFGMLDRYPGVCGIVGAHDLQNSFEASIVKVEWPPFVVKGSLLHGKVRTGLRPWSKFETSR